MGIILEGELVKRRDRQPICGGCKEAVNKQATVCQSCGIRLYTVKGKVFRATGTLFGAVYLTYGIAQASVISTLLGSTFMTVAVYSYFFRPML